MFGHDAFDLLHGDSCGDGMMSNEAWGKKTYLRMGGLNIYSLKRKLVPERMLEEEAVEPARTKEAAGAKFQFASGI